VLRRLQAGIAREESGFTLLELLVVIVILGILLAIALPAYLSLKGRSQFTAAESDVRSALPAVEAFGSDNTTGYLGMSVVTLTSTFDRGFPKSIQPIAAGDATQSGYCIESMIDATHWAHVSGPSGTIRTSAAKECV